MNLKYITLLLAACWTMAGCEKEAEMETPETVAYAMFYNGSVGFYNKLGYVLVNNLDSQMVTYNSYNQNALGAFNYASYRKMHPGNYLVSFTDTLAKRLTNDVFSLEAGRHRTVYLTDSAGYYHTVVSEDDVARAADGALIRFLHLSPDNGPVTLYIDTEKINVTEDQRYRQISSWVKVAPNTKPGIRVVMEKEGVQTVLTRKSFALEAGKCYTLMLRGENNPVDGDPNKQTNLSGIINQ
ncbi:MAG: DUF4397 domain-containing protein [Candidatus Pseudobacter hemicellulosilyticus]|uniref:DUF4397 domain-containing protein n=1 Tax=Candidatus Pseudobacter hemicellulosilyticus TaxID=3121375 RepID=A0AAJ5WSR0_9BACT|nr:MAG: DUF4397 domain-containing protein [Pseudobacter sp.]